MKNLILLFSFFLFPLIAQAVELEIMHPRIEQKAAKVYELLCELHCSFKVSNRPGQQKIEKSLVEKELKELEDLAPKIGKIEIPEILERGSRIVTLTHKKGIFYKFTLPPATSWKKEYVELYSKASDILIRLEFLMDKRRAKK